MNLIELRNISKKYHGSEKKANNNISLDIKKGEILCIAGENGAGKTTLMKILCGLEKQSEGEIYIDRTLQKFNSVLDARKAGIGMLHQHFMLFNEYTAAQNIVMGIEPVIFNIFFNNRKAESIAEKIINENNFSIKSRLKVKELTLGQMQQVEICKVLYSNAQIIIFDEPTSILTEHESQSLFETFKNLVKNGKTIILITHKIQEIFKIADRIAVLCKGELIGIKNINEVDEYEIVRMMTGKINSDVNDIYFNRQLIELNENKRQDKPILEFFNVTVTRKGQKRPLLENVSFSVKKGEILGFAGVGGNGLGVIEAVLGGFLHPVKGRIFHNENDITGLSTLNLRKRGLAYVPSDRICVGSAQDATIEENLIINKRHELKKNIISLWKNNWNYFINLASKYNIDMTNHNQKASALSGGNLQKLILAREINWYKDYIVFSEPTWGLDIASSRFIMKEIENLRQKGAAIIIISTNLEEIFTLADRIIVMYHGKTAGIFQNTNDQDHKIKIQTEIRNSMQGLAPSGGVLMSNEQ